MNKDPGNKAQELKYRLPAPGSGLKNKNQKNQEAKTEIRILAPDNKIQIQPVINIQPATS